MPEELVLFPRLRRKLKEKRMLQKNEELFRTAKCGRDLEEWLTSKGLSLLDARDIISGIRDFRSTTLAFDTHGRIVDYDQYYGNVYEVRLFEHAIVNRIRREQAGKTILDRLVYYRNVPPDCLEFETERPI